jgi:nucleotide-binding universal stress UspA family protein
MARSYARILVPTDFSACAREAWSHASRIARLGGVEVIELLHVWEAPAYAGTAHVRVHSTQSDAPLSLAEYVESEARQALRRFADSLDVDRSVRLDVRLEGGEPSEVIVARAKAFDLVVLGTHGHSVLERWVFGSVADRVLRRSEVPVLAVPLVTASSTPAPTA